MLKRVAFQVEIIDYKGTKAIVCKEKSATRSDTQSIRAGRFRNNLTALSVMFEVTSQVIHKNGLFLLAFLLNVG